MEAANPVGSVALLAKNKVLLGMAAVLLLGYTAQQSLMNVYVIYCDYRYHWSDWTVGLSLAVVGTFSGLYGALLVKRAVSKLGERGAIAVGLLCGAFGWVILGSASKGSMVWASIPVLNLMAIVWPSAQSIMSKEVGVSRTGAAAGGGEQPAGDGRAGGSGTVYVGVQPDAGMGSGDGVLRGGGDPGGVVIRQ